jgi:hypothetical protein
VLLCHLLLYATQTNLLRWLHHHHALTWTVHACWLRDAAQGTALSRMITKRITEAEQLQELEDIVDEWGSSFESINTSSLFVRAAKLLQRRQTPAASKWALLDRLAAKWEQQNDYANQRGRANVLWACSKLQFANPKLWSYTLAAFRQRLQAGDQDDGTSQHIANVVYSLANIALTNKGQVPGVPSTEVEAAVRELLEHMRIVVTHPQMPGVDPQHISNSLWACAKLRINPGNAVINTLLQAFSRPTLLEDSLSQNVTNTLWAVSELRQRCRWQPGVEQRVWQRLLGEQQLKKIANSRVSGEVSNALLALQRLSSACSADEAAAPVISQEFAQTCVLQLLQGRTAQQLDTWSEQAVANSMFACAQLGVHDDRFVTNVSASAPKWLPGSVAAGVQQMAYACRVLQIRDPQLLAGIVQRSKHLLIKHRGRPLQDSDRVALAAHVGCAVGVLDMQPLAGDALQLVASSGVNRDNKLNPADASMLWQVHAWLVQQQLLDGQGLAGLLSEQQLAQGKAAAEACRAQQQA